MPATSATTCKVQKHLVAIAPWVGLLPSFLAGFLLELLSWLRQHVSHAQIPSLQAAQFIKESVMQAAKVSGGLDACKNDHRLGMKDQSYIELALHLVWVEARWMKLQRLLSKQPASQRSRLRIRWRRPVGRRDMVRSRGMRLDETMARYPEFAEFAYMRLDGQSSPSMFGAGIAVLILLALLQAGQQNLNADEERSPGALFWPLQGF